MLKDFAESSFVSSSLSEGFDFFNGGVKRLSGKYSVTMQMALSLSL
jgi:hypothetical protein